MPLVRAGLQSARQPLVGAGFSRPDDRQSAIAGLDDSRDERHRFGAFFGALAEVPEVAVVFPTTSVIRSVAARVPVVQRQSYLPGMKGFVSFYLLKGDEGE